MNDMTNPPLGTPESARDIVQTIALALKNGYTPDEILAEDSPILERIWAEATTIRDGKQTESVTMYCPTCKTQATFTPMPESESKQGELGTDTERDLIAIAARLVARLREASPDDDLAESAAKYLRTKRYLSPLRIKL